WRGPRTPVAERTRWARSPLRSEHGAGARAARGRRGGRRVSNAWDRAADMADRAANEGGIYVKLADDGDKAVGAIVGDPHPREVIWTGEAYEPYDPNNAAHKGKRPSLKVSLNFYVPGEGMKIIEMNNMT